ncbi:MAG: hypothetical protein Q8865_00345 [Bacillota bacterium]|nr:hypothetical protein [Bacillota bacterium]
MSINILDPKCNTSLISKFDPENTDKYIRKALNFVKCPGPWIYCNHPENIIEAALADNNFYLNQQNITSGESQLFASYINKTGEPIMFGVQIYNPNASQITITKTNYGFRCSDEYSWEDVQGGSWTDFFNSCETTYAIPSGGNIWILDECIPTGAFFTYNLRFIADSNAIITIYAYKDKSKITGNAVYYLGNIATDGSTYSGLGESYFLNCSFDINISSLLNKGLCSLIGKVLTNTNEIISIVQPSPAPIASETSPSPYNNLGNWGAQTLFNVCINNDTSFNKTINGYVACNPLGATPVIQSGCVVRYKSLECSDGQNVQRWNFYSHNICPGDSVQIDFQYITGTNSCTPVYLMWTAV